MTRFITLCLGVFFSLIISACGGIVERSTHEPTGTVQNPSPGGSVSEPQAPKPIDVVKPVPVPEALCEPTLVVTTVGMPSGDVAIGAKNVLMHLFTLTAKCADMEVLGAQFHISEWDFSSEDATPFCAVPCKAPEDWNFQNLKIRRSDGAVVMGPIATPKPMTRNSAVLAFHDAIFLKKGETIELGVYGDIATKLVSDIIGKRFLVLFDGAGTRAWDVLQHVYAPGVVWNATFTIVK